MCYKRKDEGIIL